MAVAEELKVKIRAEVDKAVRNMDKYSKSAGGARKSTASFGKNVASIGKMMKGGVFALGITAAIRGMRQLARAASELEDAFSTQEQAEARLAQTLESTGFAAGISQRALLDMASGLQKVTKFGDEAVIGAQALLLTFKNIGADVFPDALETVLDMSEALGQDLKQSSIQLGKALQDPVQGLTSLRRVGIQFTDAQEEQIKVMQESGNMVEAQNLILAELESQFGGVARAAADTSSAVKEQLANSIGDLKEELGEAISQGARPFREWMNGVVQNATAFVSSLNAAKAAVDALTAGEALDVTDTEAALEGLLTKQSELRQQIQLLESQGRGQYTGALEEQLNLVNRQIQEVASLNRWLAAAEVSASQYAEQQALAAAKAEAARLEQERITAELTAQAQIVEQRYQAGLAQMEQVISNSRTEMERLQDQIEFFASFQWAAGQTAQLETQATAIALLTEQFRAAQREAALANIPLVEAAENVSRLKGNLVDTPEEWERFGQTGSAAVQIVIDKAKELEDPAFQERVAGFVEKVKEKYEELLPAINAARDTLSAFGDLSQDIHDREIERLTTIRDQYERGSEEYEKAQEQIDQANEERAKKEFRREKILALAQAAMNTAVGVTKMLALGRVGMAVTVGALGLAQIGAIALQQGPGGGGGGGSRPSTASASAPSPDVTKGGGGGGTYNVYYYTQNVQGSIHAERDLEEIGANGFARQTGAF